MKSNPPTLGNSSPVGDVNLLDNVSQEELLELTRNNPSRWAIQHNMLSGPYGDDYGIRPEPSILQKWWRVICIRKWLVIITTAVMSLLAAAFVYSIRPTYQATAIIEVAKENASLIQISKDLIVHTDDSIKTKKFLLQSTPLLEDVIVNLQLDRQPGFVATRETWFGGAAETASGTSDDKRQEKQPQDAAIAGDVKPTGERTVLSEGSERRPPEESRRLEPFVKVLEDNLAVEEIRDSRLLNVSFTHTDPVIAAAVSNGVVEALMRSSFDTKVERFNTASGWLDRQTRELRTKVEQAEQELADYTRAHNVISNTGSETVTADKLSRLHGEAMRAESERILKQSLYAEVQNGNVEQLPDAFTNLAAVELRTKLNELTTKLAQLSVNYGPENPQTIEVQQQIAAIQKQIEANKRRLEAKLKSDYERAVSDEQEIRKVLSQATSEAVRENQTAIRYSILKQQFDTSKTLYADFLQKTSQANFEASQQSSSVRVIQPARVPKETKPPKRWQVLILGLALSLGTGIGLAFVVEKLDTKINTVEQLTRYVQLPALGIIPPIARTSMPVKQHNLAIGLERKILGTDLVAVNGQSAAAEAYRVLRTSVLLSPVGSVPKIILFTSSQPGEGKTTTTVNTALSLAQLGASVLIIDCDLRTPKVHELLNTDQSPGLSTFLLDDLRLEDVIHGSGVPNLSLLPAGPVPSNPSELISSEKLKNVLSALAQRYDHIIIDSPPLIHLADPLILSTLVDGVILVVDGAKTTCEAALSAREELLSVGANIVGVVLNKFDSRRKTYGGYY